MYDDFGNNHFHFDYNVSILRLSLQTSNNYQIQTKLNEKFELISVDEVFKPIAGYSYQISNYGRVKNQWNHIIASHLNNINYCIIKLYVDGKPKGFSIHHLVAESFLSNPNNYPFVKHKDKNRLNNHANNLYFTNKSPKLKISNFDNRYIYYKPHLNQYEVQINYQKKNHHFGRYDTIQEAQQVRDKSLNSLKTEYEEQKQKIETNYNVCITNNNAKTEDDYYEYDENEIIYESDDMNSS